MAKASTALTTDRRLLRGERTRQAILSHASRLASAEGLEAVSLQRLASDLGISKSGLFAHFGSKEELQLATVEEAGRVFTEEVLKPGLKTPAGIGRVWAMCNSFLSYLSRGVFPGGCFFEAALSEFDSKPGRIRDAVVEKRGYWVASLARAIREAKPAGDIQADVDADQVAWELGSLLVGANSSFVQDGGTVGIERARRAIRDRLERIATPSATRLPTR
ncbi:MAG TPA: TetR/AcrR family transcriptional regulator [Candidatus Limnocylindria bacterium]|jgi:AcrR family transcriptional regulator|nr:TetR/AcrR family transcriptional regulator [Candidatus Limnocylindria bacterium]